MVTFQLKKTEDDGDHEIAQLKKLTQNLSSSLRSKINSLHNEFNTWETPEEKLANALDKLAAVIQHNDADISTWDNIEYELSLTYGQNHTDYHPFLKLLRLLVKEATIKNGLGIVGVYMFSNIFTFGPLYGAAQAFFCCNYAYSVWSLMSNAVTKVDLHDGGKKVTFTFGRVGG